MSTIAAILGLFGGLVAAPADDAKAQLVKPTRPIVQPSFRMVVQKKPRFPGGPRPEPSKPAVERGLSVTIQPERKEFAGNGPLAFQVVLKNDSKATFMLYGADQLGRQPRLVIANLETTTQWIVTKSNVIRPAAASTTLAPGKSLTYTIVV